MKNYWNVNIDSAPLSVLFPTVKSWTTTINSKTGKPMRHLWKENKNLKQHVYKLKQVETPTTMKRNK